MAHYCLISKCANLGRNPVFNSNLNSIFCEVIKSADILRDKLKRYKYVPNIDPNYSNTEQDKEYDDSLNLNNGDDICFSYLTEPNLTEGKPCYIDYILQNVTNGDNNNKLYSFTKLSLNYDCCELYLYVTTEKEKIVFDDNYKHEYVLLTDNEKKALWKMC